MENKNVKNLARLIRGLGALSLILSGGVFLVQGYNSWNGFERFMMFSGLLSVVGALGVLCARVLKEPKGARTFLALATMGVSALFAQYGGILFDLIVTDNQRKLPGIMEFSVSGLAQVGIAGAVLTAVAGVFSYLGFKILDRDNSVPFSISFLILNCLLLLPVRGGLGSLLMLAALAMSIVYLSKIKSVFDPVLASEEQYIGVMTIMVPPLICVIRSSFYSSGILFFASITGFMTIASFFLEYFFHAKRYSQLVGHQQGSALHLDGPSLKVTVGLGMLTWFVLLFKILSHLHLPFHGDVAVFMLSFHANWRFLRRTLLVSEKVDQLPALWAIGGFLVFISCYSNLTYGGMSLLLGLGALMVVEGFLLRQIGLAKMGVGALIAGILGLFIVSALSVNVFHWVNLAIAGGIGVLLASQIERYSAGAKVLFRRIQSHFE